MTEKKAVQKALPFKDYDGGWTGVPNAIFELYSFHKKFTGACLRVYLYLLHRHNQKEGYAWPTQDQMADDLCLNRRTVRTAIKSLKELDLIEVVRNPEYSNDVYFLKRPISDRHLFEQKFPEAKERREKHEEARELDKKERYEARAEFERKRELARKGQL